jgi:heat shock protein HtpX
MAKWMMGVKVIDPQTRDSQAQQLIQTVHHLAKTAGLTVMPQVGVYDSPELNAFATGPMKSRSLVAVSSGLLQQMNRSELEGVLGHEIAHIANGDMVTMTLLQGIVNAFVMFLARALAFIISNALRDRNERGGGLSGIAQFFLIYVLEIVFMIFGSLVVAWFSRQREFRADAGSARYAGREKMIAALRSLQAHYEIKNPIASRQIAVDTLKISGKRSKWFSAFATHPALELRIQRLETLRQ